MHAKRVASLVVAFAVGILPAVVSAQEGAQLEAYEYLKKANRYYEAGEVGDAIKYYQKAIRIMPNLMEAWERLLAIDYSNRKFEAVYERSGEALSKDAPESKKAGVYMWRGLAGQILHKADAIESLEKAVSLDSSLFLAYYEPLNGVGLGRHYQFQMKWDKAIHAYKMFLKHRPSSLAKEVDHVVYFRLGECYLYKGMAADALEVCEKSAKLRPTYLSAIWCKAESLRRLERYGEAYLFFRKVVRYANKHPRILQGMAVSTLYTGKGYRALSYARRYTELRPEDPYGYALLGDIQYALGDYARAIGSYRKAIALDKGVKAFYIKLGVLFYRIKNYGESEKVLTRALELFPGDEDIIVPLAYALAAQKKFKEAESILAGTKVRDVIRVNTIKARVLLGLGKVEDAITLYRQVYPHKKGDEQIARNYTKALLLLAQGRVGKGAFAEAKKLLLEGLSVIPNSVIILKDLALVSYLLGQKDEARNYLKKLSSQSVDDFFTNRLLGRMALDEGRYQEALKYLAKAEQAARRLTSSTLARVQLDYAIALMATGHPEEGVDMLELARTSALEIPKLVERIEANLRRARLVRAVYRISTGKPKKALDDLKLLMEEVEGKEAKRRLYFLMSMAHLELGNWKKASYYLSRAGKLEQLGSLFKKEYAEVGPMVVKGYILYRQGSFSLAKDLFQKALGKAPKRLRAELQLFIQSCDLHLSYNYLRKGAVRQSLSLLKGLPERVLDERTRSNLAVALYYSGKKQKALSIWKSLNTPLAACNLAAHYHNTGQPKQAYPYYKRCVDAGLAGKKGKHRLNVLQRLFGLQ